jgi:small subunit ribosomal protein S17
MAEEEKQEQEEKAAEEEAPVEEPTAAEEEAPAEEPAAEEPAEEPAAEEESATEAAEGGDAGTSSEAAEEAAEPAAPSEPEPAGNGAEGEASGGDVSEDVGGETLSPKQLRKRERSRASGPARPSRSPEERATERAEGRRTAAERRRRHRAARRRKRGEPAAGTPPAPRVPGPKKVRQGTVVSTGGDKTITVEIAVVRRHATYEKVVRRTSKLRAHDESNQAREGDTVRVVESRPLSRTKRWRLLEVLERAPR